MKYSDEEKEKLLDYMSELTLEELAEFVAVHEFDQVRTKADYRRLFQSLLSQGKLTYTVLTEFLDKIGPTRSQHVFLLKGPTGLAKEWRNETFATKRMSDAGVISLSEKRTSLILPTELTLSRIAYSKQRLQVFAVARREGEYRDKKRDFNQDEDGEHVLYKAYVESVERGLVMLDWNLLDSTATLHITQLPSGMEYSAERGAIADLLKPWLDISQFDTLEIPKAIKALHALAEKGQAEARPQAIDYKTAGGRTAGGRGASTGTSVLGEAIVDRAMKDFRENGVAHIGNFWWLPNKGLPEQEIHVFLNGPDNRVNFTTRNTQGTINYVLDRIRAHCA